MSDHDVIVLGGGAPGEHCAAALAARGLRVAAVERELVGGECSYWACIPSKSLLRPGEAAQQANEAAATARVDVAAVLAWRDFMVSGYSDAGQQRWLAGRGIGLLRAPAGWPALLGDDLGARRDQLRATLPIGRVVGPADVAALAVHIMTNTALTGATYGVDGGQQLIARG